MADAVAVGADPLRFAAAPALTVIGKHPPSDEPPDGG